VVADGSSSLKHGALTERIIRVFYDVYSELGNGFLESVYEESMMIALRQEGIDASRQVPVAVSFRGYRVGDFRVDLLVENKVLLEVKCVRALEAAHEAQVLHYLKSTDVEVALLLNFGPRPNFRRFIFDNERKKLRENPCISAAEVSA
jgi:GxxExxY protein